MALDPMTDEQSSAPGAHIWGWMNPAELEWLRSTAATMDSAVEVGSLRGRSAFALLTGCPGPVYCVDPWDDARSESRPAFEENCGHFPNLVMIQGYSPAAAAEVPDVDFVFIDGAHDYASVVADLDAWTPKARRLISGHDYYDTDAWSVRTAVDQRFGGRVELVPGTAIWTVAT